MGDEVVLTEGVQGGDRVDEGGEGGGIGVDRPAVVTDQFGDLSGGGGAGLVGGGQAAGRRERTVRAADLLVQWFGVRVE